MKATAQPIARPSQIRKFRVVDAAMVAVLSAAIVLGSLQSILRGFGFYGVLYLDDAFILVAALLALLTTHRAVPAMPYLFACVWLVWHGVHLLTQAVGPGAGALEYLSARQIIVPGLVVLIGLTLHPCVWRRVSTVAITVSLVTAWYCVYEKVSGSRPIDPVPVANLDGIFLAGPGLPGYYVSYFASGEYVRAGGPFLNPPIAGIVTAIGAVLIAERNYRFQMLHLAVLVLATFLTFSRAGIVILLVGLLYRWVAGRYGSKVGFVGVVAGAFVGAPFVTTLGSEAHLEGLGGGLRAVIESPFGGGFGTAGNLIAGTGLDVPSESLASIAMVAGGLMTSTILAIAIIACLVPPRSPRLVPFRLLGVGMLIAALFAETAGSISGTVAGWLALGVGFSVTEEGAGHQTTRFSEGGA